MKKTGEIIKECLKQKGLNQSDLADAMGVSDQRISQKVSVNQDIKFQEAARFLDSVGFDLVIEDRVSDWKKNVKNF